MRFPESRRLISEGEIGVTFRMGGTTGDGSAVEAVAVGRKGSMRARESDKKDKEEVEAPSRGSSIGAREEGARAPIGEATRGPEDGGGRRRDVGEATRGPEDGSGRRQDVGEATRGPEDGGGRRQEVEEEIGSHADGR